jgi:hypothetical protein
MLAEGLDAGRTELIINLTSYDSSDVSKYQYITQQYIVRTSWANGKVKPAPLRPNGTPPDVENAVPLTLPRLIETAWKWK